MCLPGNATNLGDSTGTTAETSLGDTGTAETSLAGTGETSSDTQAPSTKAQQQA